MSQMVEDHTIVMSIPFDTDEKLNQEMIPFFESIEKLEEDGYIQTSHMTKKAMNAIYMSLQKQQWDSCYLDIFSFFENKENQYLPIDFEMIRPTISFYKEASLNPVEGNEFILNLRKEYNCNQHKEENDVYLPVPTLIITQEKINQILDYFSKYGIKTKLDVLHYKERNIYQLDGLFIWFD